MMANKTFSTEIGLNQTNLYLVNSKYEMNGITSVYGSYNNIESYDSSIRVEQLRNKFAQNIGLLMSNSSFKYNKNLNSSAVGQFNQINVITGASGSNYPILFVKNGQHVVLKGGSTYGPTLNNSTLNSIDITTLYNMEMYVEHQGTIRENATNRLSKPAIVVDNSTAQFTCSKILCSEAPSDLEFVYNSPAAILSTNNASVTVMGLGDMAAGSNTVSYATGNQSRYSVGYLADKGSSIHFTGPNVICNFGICAAALNGSKISVGVPMTEYGTPDFTPSGWGRGLYAAVPVMEVHSGRACFVADNNSNLVFEDVGSSLRYWNRFGNLALSANSDYGLLLPADEVTYKANLVASGGLQFYPNGFLPLGTGWDNTIGVAAKGNFRKAYDYTTFTAGGYTNTLAKDVTTSSLRILYNANYDTLDDPEEMQQISQGGMCVRATGGSNVKVRNVHFPTGWPNTDGSFYDASSSPAGCDNLMIWNIADTSRLHASYIAVSGAYPSDAGYRGPRSFYTSGGVVGRGFQQDSSTVSYTLPSGTPHTSRLAVLDHFGSGTLVSGANMGDAANMNRTYPTTNPDLSATHGFMSAIQESRIPAYAGNSSATYGEATAENQGAFRLYFSVLPAAKMLSYVSGNPVRAAGAFPANPEDTKPYQHLSQGYLLSGDCSGPKEFSGLYPQLLNQRLYDQSGLIYTSGYYYPSALMPQERADVWLDESAANLFANAKHCNTNYSNRIKLVNIYKAKTSNEGEAQTPTEARLGSAGLGLGFRSANIFDIDREI
jgi:hypothetical protein